MIMTTEQIWEWNNFIWWEGDWFYYGPAWSFKSWLWIDTRTLENWVKLENAIVETWNTYNWSVLSINKDEDLSFSVRDGDVWKIYKDWVYKFTINTWDIWHNMVRGFWKMTKNSDNTEYTYCFTETNAWVWKVYRTGWAFSWFTSVWWTRACEFLPENSYKMSVISLPWRIIFWYNNTIFKIDQYEVITKLISFPKNAKIIEITYFQDTFKIFYNIWKNWYINYWDWFSNSVSQYIKYENSAILTVVNDWWNDYVVFWNTLTSDLYISQWLQRQQLRVNVENWLNWTNNRSILWPWVMREWILYIVWKNKEGFRNIYTYWNFFNWTNKSLVPWNTISWVEWILNTTLYWDNSIYFLANNKIYSQSMIIWDWRHSNNQTWYIISYPCIWNSWIHTLKALKKIYIWYSLHDERDSISIYIKKNWWPFSNSNNWFVLLKTITWPEYINKKGYKISENEINNLDLWDFYELEYKVVLNVFYNTTPILYWIKTHYLDNLKD